MSKLSILYFIVILCCLQIVVLGQDSINDPMSGFDHFVSKRTEDSPSSDSILNSIDDSVNYKKYQYLIAEWEYLSNSLDQRRSAYEWSHTSTILIFWMVMIIVAFGLVFSAIQFYISMLTARSKVKNPSGKEDSVNGNTNPTSVKISLSGLEVNSSVLGIIILIISLAFFYLYLIYVYPIREYKIENETINPARTEVSK